MSAPPNPADRTCTLLLSYDSNATYAKEAEFMQQLEQKDDQIKIEALKNLIANVVAGESYPKLLMSVIKYCLHSENHAVKKLLLLYWEVVDKRNKDGALLSEMILVCNAMKNNLTHANEFIRGSTLRFLCKIKDAEILESLIPSVTQNLEHRHSYVRKNAVLTVFHIFQAHAELIPDAPELIETFLYNESNPSAKRNAFLMLFHCDQSRAQTFLQSVANTVGSMGESFQLVVLELIRKVVRSDPSVRGEYIRCVFTLVNSPSHAVAYDAANTLVALSSAPTAVRAAIGAYCSLLQHESDHNIKLAILSRLLSLRRRHAPILQESLMDLLRTLSSPSMDIRRRTMELAIELLSPRNVDDVVGLLRKELLATDAAVTNAQEANAQFSMGSSGSASGANLSGQALALAYRKMLMESLHACCVRYSSVVPTVANVLLHYLGDEVSQTGVDVMLFLRESVHEYPALRDALLERIMDAFDDIRISDVYRCVTWLLGEYATKPMLIERAMQTIRSSVGALPLLSKLSPVVPADAAGAASVAEEKKTPAASTPAASAAKKGPVVLADGTYASTSAATTGLDSVSSSASATAAGSKPSLRSLILAGDYILGGVVANSYAKLTLRYTALVGPNTPEANEEHARALLLAVSVLKLGQSPLATKSIDVDSASRLTALIQSLLSSPPARSLWGVDAPDAAVQAGGGVLTDMLNDQRLKMMGREKMERQRALREGKQPKKQELVKQADDLILIRQLKGRGAVDEDMLDEEDESADLARALGQKTSGGQALTSGGSTLESAQRVVSSKLSRVYQLTGFSDPVYVESHLRVSDFDIGLELLVVNRTDSILQNMQVELHTSGDLKLVERPQAHTLAPGASQRLRASIKLSSTESGVIFGNVVYDNAAGTSRSIVVLSNIHLDVIDYISPASCSDVAFRAMWAEFEWENKVAVNTDLTDLGQYLDHILSITNMQCMTPPSTRSGSAAFLAANLYARSMFGEDALLNLSVEKQKSGKISGYIRIRSKTQGIALSLGDKIQAKQRGNKQ